MYGTRCCLFNVWESGDNVGHCVGSDGLRKYSHVSRVDTGTKFRKKNYLHISRNFNIIPQNLCEILQPNFVKLNRKYSKLK
jgi:hypothetical protein